MEAIQYFAERIKIGLTERGWCVSNFTTAGKWPSRRFRFDDPTTISDELPRVEFVFHCPCGRPIREMIALPLSLYGPVNMEVAVRSTLESVHVDLRKHVDEEARRV